MTRKRDIKESKPIRYPAFDAENPHPLDASEVNLLWSRLFPLLAAAGLAASTGCLAVKTVTMPIKLAARTVVAAGETAGAAVTTTGRVAVAAVTTTGSVTAGSLEAAAALSEVGMVTFVDAATGAIVRVPWEEGMNLQAGSTVAKVRTAQRALALIRAGRAVYSASRYDSRAAALELLAGDVIRLVPGE